MSKMKKTEKLQTLILENLIYLRLRADEKAIEERLTELLRISASHTMSVSGPYYLINSVDRKFKMVE